jgi:L-amino acid N-acyltransferase
MTVRDPGPFRLRSARPGDAQRIRAIYNAAVAGSVATFDTRPRTLAAQRAWLRGHDARHPVLVAMADGRIVGWASLSPWSERPAYDATAEDSVYVDELWRGRGLGRALLAELLRRADALGYHSVLARIADRNAASHRLHAAFGFREIGVMHEVGRKFGRYVDVALLERISRGGRRSRAPAAVRRDGSSGSDRGGRPRAVGGPRRSRPRSGRTR